MPRLVRNTTEDGTCKYALVRLDKFRKLNTAKQLRAKVLMNELEELGIFELAGKNDPEECFVIKLKDIHAPHALFAYARSMDEYDPELAQDVFELASRGAHRRDARHPTV